MAVFKGLKSTLAESRDLGRFLTTDPEERPIVFYAEDTFTYVQYEGYVSSLLAAGRKIGYVTSAAHDPLLADPPSGLQPFYVDKQLPRLFEKLDSKVLAITMPDLGQFHVPVPPVGTTAYVFHSLNSTHTAYRTGAFDHYDAFLCTGPHHVAELRALRSQRGLPEPELFEVGYYKLDRIIRDHAAYTKKWPTDTTVLVAPSWGRGNILEAHGAEVVSALRAEGFRVIVRPHPQFFHSLYPEGEGIVAGLERQFGDDPLVVIEKSIDTEDSFHEADVMVSDWSGAAYEYALGTLRPVAFIETPQKIFNDEWQEIGLGSFERDMRSRVGRIVEPSAVGELVAEMVDRKNELREELEALRHQVVFNVGKAAAVGAEVLGSLADR